MSTQIPAFINRVLTGLKSKKFNFSNFPSYMQLVSETDEVFPPQYGIDIGTKLSTVKAMKNFKYIQSEEEKKDPAPPPEEPVTPTAVTFFDVPDPNYFVYSSPLVRALNGEYVKLKRRYSIMLPYKRLLADFNVVVAPGHIMPLTESPIEVALSEPDVAAIVLFCPFIKNRFDKYISFLFLANIGFCDIRMEISDTPTYFSVETVLPGELNRNYLDIKTLATGYHLLRVSLHTPLGPLGVNLSPITVTADSDNFPLPGQDI